MKYITIAIILNCLTFALTGCNLKPEASNTVGRLIIVCDEIDRPILRQSIESSFGQIIYTPQPEPLFNLTWVDGDALGSVTRLPLLLIAAPLNGVGQTATLMNDLLSPEVKSGTSEGKYSMFVRSEPWAKGQLMMILASSDQRTLGLNASTKCDSLLQLALESEYSRLRDSMLSGAINIEERSRLLQNHSVELDLQIDYLLAQDNDSLAFVRYLRYGPERWITVAWGDMTDPDSLSPEFVFRRRQKIGRAFVDPVITYDERWTAQPSRLNDQDAILLRGLWATESSIGGGPFFCYALHVPEEGKYYLVDGAVLVPGETKIEYLWQLDVIAQTFNSRTEAKEDKL